jgi:hypothetical protein
VSLIKRSALRARKAFCLISKRASCRLLISGNITIDDIRARFRREKKGVVSFMLNIHLRYLIYDSVEEEKRKKLFVKKRTEKKRATMAT